MKKPNLHQELLSHGANRQEAEELLEIARYLRNKPDLMPHFSADAKAKTWEDINSATTEKLSAKLGFYGKLAGASGAVVFAMLVIVSQNVLPGSNLYFFKSTSEKARAIVQPAFKKTIVQRRKSEVEELKKQGAPQSVIKKAEANLAQSSQALKNSDAAESSAAQSSSNSTDQAPPDSLNQSTLDNLNQPGTAPTSENSTPTTSKSGKSSGGGSHSSGGDSGRDSTTTSR